MKKSVFTLLAIAFAVITMSSCSQNDGGSSNDLNLSSNKVESQNKETKDYYGVRVVLNKNMMDLGTYIVTVQADGQSQSFDVNKDATKTCLSKTTSQRTTTSGKYTMSTSNGYFYNGYEFTKTIYSKTGDVKFTVSFAPNADFTAPEDNATGQFIYGVEYVNSASASMNWSDDFKVEGIEWANATAKAQSFCNQASHTFTK